MGRFRGTGALALAAMLAVGVPAPLAAKDEPKEATATAPGKVPPELLAIQKSLKPQSGDVRIPEAKAVLHLGDRYYFLDAADTRRVLVDAWRNPPDSIGNVLGMVLEKDSTIYNNVWGAVVTYQDTGHISDADAKDQDYAKVLSDMQQGEEEDNRRRAEAGYSTMKLVGWAQPPSYDQASHSLIWARELQQGGEPVNGLNYDVRLLGRTGVLSLNMVAGMPQLPEVRTAAQALGKSVTFEPGAAYADYDASTDKTAEYGLAGLVAGGAAVAVAQKAGLLAIVFKFGKFILLGLLAFGGAIFGFFRRGAREEEI